MIRSLHSGWQLTVAVSVNRWWTKKANALWHSPLLDFSSGEVVLPQQSRFFRRLLGAYSGSFFDLHRAGFDKLLRALRNVFFLPQFEATKLAMRSVVFGKSIQYRKCLENTMQTLNKTQILSQEQSCSSWKWAITLKAKASLEEYAKSFVKTDGAFILLQVGS